MWFILCFTYGFGLGWMREIWGFKYAVCTCSITCFKLCDNTKVQSTFCTYGFFVQDANAWTWREVTYSKPITVFPKRILLSLQSLCTSNLIISIWFQLLLHNTSYHPSFVSYANFIFCLLHSILNSIIIWFNLHVKASKILFEGCFSNRKQGCIKCGSPDLDYG